MLIPATTRCRIHKPNNEPTISAFVLKYILHTMRARQRACTRIV